MRAKRYRPSETENLDPFVPDSEYVLPLDRPKAQNSQPSENSLRNGRPTTPTHTRKCANTPGPCTCGYYEMLQKG